MTRTLTPFVRLTARVALFSFVLQLAAFGHWGFGPVRADPGDLTLHAQHCHGSFGGCAGESSLTGSLLDQALTAIAPDAVDYGSVTTTARPAAVGGPPLLQPPIA